jgi:hypothetical protein
MIVIKKEGKKGLTKGREDGILTELSPKGGRRGKEKSGI